MQLTEDLDVFLADFGDEVTGPRGMSGLAIVNQADKEIFGGFAQTPDFGMVCRADIFGSLRDKDAIEITTGESLGGYFVCGPVKSLGADRAFVIVPLNRTVRR